MMYANFVGSYVVLVFLSNRFFFSSPGMAFAVAYINTPNIRFWRSLDRYLKKTSWSLAGALTCLLQRGFAGTVCVRQICSVISLSLSRLSPLFPLVSWVIISWRTSLLMSCPIVCSSSNWSSVSVIPPTPRTITFNAINASKITACLVHLLLKCKLSSLSWINMSAFIGAASKTSSVATIRTSFSSVLLWNTVSL